MKEYKLAKGWAVFIYLTAPLLIAVFGYLLLMPLLPGAKGDKILQLYWFLAPVCLVMITVFIIGLINTAKGRFVIDAGRVYTTGILSNRELLLHQVKGFRTDDRYIYIIPAEKGLKQIKVSLYFSGTAEILDWLSGRYPDLDRQDAEEEQQQILSSEDLGYRTEDREAQLQKARSRAKALNWAGGLIAAWTLFLPQPYKAAILACLLVPLVCLLVSRVSKGLIRVEEKKNSVHPSVFAGVFFPALSLCLRALMDFNLLAYVNVWKATLLVAALFMFLLLMNNKAFAFRTAKEWGLIAGLFVLALPYSFGAAVTINCVFDRSAAKVYPAQVTGKHISKGKTTTYYLTLTAWGPRRADEDVAVSRSLYNRLQISNGVSVWLRQGALAIPWFLVTE